MAFYRDMTCENVTIHGHGGTPITAYVARPSGPGPHPGVVLIHHLLRLVPPLLGGVTDGDHLHISLSEEMAEYIAAPRT